MSMTAVIGIAVALAALALMIGRAPSWLARLQQEGSRWARIVTDDLARRHGLQKVSRGGGHAGTVDGRPVKVVPVRARAGQPPAVDVVVAVQVPPGVLLVPVSEIEAGAALARTGDAAFDRRWRLGGGPLALTAFPTGVRKALGRLGYDRVAIAQGQLSVRVPTDACATDAVEARLAGVLAAAMMIDATHPGAQGLLDLGLGDLVPAVRTTALEAAIRLAAGDASAARLLRPLVGELEPALRVEAAKVLGPEGLEILIGLARSPTVRAAVRISAFIAAVQRGATGVALAGVPNLLLLAASPAARAELLEACGQSNTLVAADILRRCTSDPSTEVRIATAKLLGVHPDQATARVALDVLLKDGAPAVVYAAAAAQNLPADVAHRALASVERRFKDQPKVLSAARSVRSALGLGEAAA